MHTTNSRRRILFTKSIENLIKRIYKCSYDNKNGHLLSARRVFFLLLQTFENIIWDILQSAAILRQHQFILKRQKSGGLYWCFLPVDKWLLEKSGTTNGTACESHNGDLLKIYGRQIEFGSTSSNICVWNKSWNESSQTTSIKPHGKRKFHQISRFCFVSIAKMKVCVRICVRGQKKNISAKLYRNDFLSIWKKWMFAHFQLSLILLFRTFICHGLLYAHDWHGHRPIQLAAFAKEITSNKTSSLMNLSFRF